MYNDLSNSFILPFTLLFVRNFEIKPDFFNKQHCSFIIHSHWIHQHTLDSSITNSKQFQSAVFVYSNPHNHNSPSTIFQSFNNIPILQQYSNPSTIFQSC